MAITLLLVVNGVIVVLAGVVGVDVIVPVVDGFIAAVMSPLLALLLLMFLV